ncbi:hypothetical protein [Stakelama saccharophila]|uniref:Uncharacterized protein n=1 Tax=Stakelama saccharophila TaxID=3075605 RepID=A0ABZ0BB71_9SPHN|nr:hypothetical protein [Stakelama sp. W311]WNO54629.1 hypothetical protein RPR59_05090 [Stakelama sp. W311]
MTEAELFRNRAAHDREAADAATLDPVRDRHLRSAAVWTSMANRSERVAEQRERNEAEKAANRTAEYANRIAE